METDAKPLDASRRSRLAIPSLVIGGILILAGIVGALGPLITRDASACVNNVQPPADFTARHQEGITATGEMISLFPFGAQCSYLAPSTGETALSVVPLWPTISVLGGVAGIALGATTLAVSRRAN
ncbi:hypothetical protein [Microbacterium aurantiacum]|uniref:Uncharacterized protein n=1 Tax=Microbacterium aurantiacum TaxID=162393 RepID=A0AAJ2HLZ6_9MICO|nr:hypothetical protein [Microbacterium aurantiacum]MDS0246471.1 hypothetical protein [Microbacterium aurantiacum]